MDTVRIEGTTGSTEFRGTLVAETSNYSEEKLRWLEIKLYRTPEGWAIHRASYSDVYHRFDTSCRIKNQRKPGRPGTFSELNLDVAMPCPDCNPPERMDPATRIRIETTRHTLVHCTSVADVVEDLITDRKTGQVYFTSPVSDLLAKAAASAPEFTDVPQQRFIRID